MIEKLKSYWWWFNSNRVQPAKGQIWKTQRNESKLVKITHVDSVVSFKYDDIVHVYSHEGWNDFKKRKLLHLIYNPRN